MTHRRKQLGAYGEQLAEDHLKRNGLKIIERNYRAPGGEIDLIARDGRELVFIEVKTRTTDRFGTGAEAVTGNKQRRIANAAQVYLLDKRLHNTSVRFDVVAVDVSDGAADPIRWLRNAFDAPVER